MQLVGNINTQEQVVIAMRASKSRNMSMPHMLFSGAAGCGKTSTARMVASVSDVDFIPVIPQSLKKMGDMWRLFEKLNDTNYSINGDRIGTLKPSIIFIDEIHNLKPLEVQEWLGIAMENFMLESDSGGKYIWLPYFTLIGATTDDGKLSKAFRDRFKLRFTFEPYSFEESMKILRCHATRLDISITVEATKAVAKRGKGVPRILVGYLERVRDMASVCGQEIVTEEIVERTFKSLNIDESGLTRTEQKILKTLYDIESPVGIDNLSIIVNESPKTLLHSIEPFLIQNKLMIRTGKGRTITDIGVRYLEKNGYFGEVKKKAEIKMDYVRK